MYELKKIGKVLTSKSVGTGPSSYKKKNNLPGRGLTKVEKHCSSQRSGLPKCLPIRFQDQNLICIPLHFHLCYGTCSAQPSPTCHPNNIGRKYESTQQFPALLLTFQCSSANFSNTTMSVPWRCTWGVEVQIHSLLTSALVVDIVQLHAPAALQRRNDCRYSLNTRFWDPLHLPRCVGDIFLGEYGGNLPTSLQANYYFVCGLADFTVVWFRTSALAYYDMSRTGYQAAGRNIPEGHGPYLFGRWEVVLLITLAVNWLIGISNNKDTDKNLSSRKADNLTFLQIQTQRSIPGKKDIRQSNWCNLKTFSTRYLRPVTG